jgi:hypothetical protein
VCSAANASHSLAFDNRPLFLPYGIFLQQTLGKLTLKPAFADLQKSISATKGDSLKSSYPMVKR